MSDDVTIPDMTSVKSSNVEAIGHDPATQSLHVRFKGGAHYVYSGVDEDLHQKLMSSDSVGKFIHARVKGVFNAKKL